MYYTKFVDSPDRYRLLRQVDRAGLAAWASRRRHRVRAAVAACWAYSVVMHLPYFFQYEVVPCQEGGRNETEDGEYDDGGGECWTHVNRGGWCVCVYN